MRLSLICLLGSAFAAAQSSSSTASAAASSASAPSSNATSYLTGLLGALQAANLTSLVSVASAVANTTTGLAFLSSLAVGNKTVFAPSNAAFANVSSAVASNGTLLEEILSYHILNNTYAAAGIATAPNHTIARTLLRGGEDVLPGNFSAPLVLAKTGNGSFSIIQATSNITVNGNATTVGNLQLYVIDELISTPPTIATAAGQLLPALTGVINRTGLLAPLEQSIGITVFAPNNAAIANVTAALGQLNGTQIATIIANHVINGSVVYSTGLSAGNHTSAGGEPFTFVTNSSGSFVSSASSTARIVQSDIIVSNGVVHIIDGVLVNAMSNTTAAAAAYSSGIAAAATSTEPTAPVTATSAPATSSSKTSKAEPVLGLHALAVLAPAAAVLAGGAWLLL